MNTNINIIDTSKHVLKYMIDYRENNEQKVNSYKFNQDDKLYLYDEDSSFKRKTDNSWEPVDKLQFKDISVIPQNTYTSTVALCIPQHSVHTYENGVLYALTINTWIRDKEIVLGTYVINNLDCLALDKPIHKNETIYYECYQVTILNPKYILYSPEWKEFREEYCGINQIKDQVLNTTGSIINFSLHPVEWKDGVYKKMDKYYGGQNSINLVGDTSNHLGLEIHDNLNQFLNQQEPSIIGEVTFNKFYQSLEQYLKETYNITDFVKEFELVIGNKDMIYVTVNKPESIFTKTEINNALDKWEQDNHAKFKWQPGLKIVCSLNITNNEESIIYILSNELLFDLNKYSYFRKDDWNINCVNIKDIDMELYNLNVVNKIEENIITMEKAEDVKSNLIQPVFFKSYPLANLILHPEVTENICLNLDIYKSRVQTFLLKIDGNMFKEIGRVPSGVLFKIRGSLLKKDEGVYYILNENEELVTSGKYNCEA